MENIFLWLSGTAFAGAAKFIYDGYAYSRAEANIRHADDVPDSLPHYQKINGTILGCNPLMHLGADNTLEQYDNTIYLETRIQQIAQECDGEVKDLKPNESIYLSIAPVFSMRLLNSAKCTVYTNGVNPYFLSLMSHPVRSTPIITEKQEMIGTPIHPPVPTTIVKAGSERVYGVGTGEEVTIYGDLTRYENGFCVQASPYKFCPFLITNGSKRDVIEYFQDQQFNSYFIGLSLLAAGGICMFYRNKHQKVSPVL